MARRKKAKPEIAKPLPKWKPPAPSFNPDSDYPGNAPLLFNHDPAAPIGPFSLLEASIVSVPANAGAIIAELESADVGTEDELSAVNYLAALLGLTGAQALAYRQAGREIKNPVPPMMTPESIGDATGYCDARRVFVYGYPYRAGCAVNWAALALPSLAVTGAEIGGGFRIENVPHLLGATYRLDVHGGDYYRAIYSGPRTAGHRQRVLWSGGGDFAFCCDCEGWDTIIAAGTFPGTAVQLSQWRGTPRVWLGFLTTTVAYEGEDAAGHAAEQRTVYSGLAGFTGEAWRMFAEQVLPGTMPSRVFVEWCCETLRFPRCMIEHAARCGFNCERN